jgi:hypothetical protein
VEWRRELLQAEGVTLVVNGAWSDRSMAKYDLSASPDLQLVFARPHAQIYRLRDRARAQN